MKNLKNLFLACCIFGSIGTAKAQVQTSGDIMYSVMINHTRDYDNCKSDFFSNRDVTISNSFVGDSVKFIDFGGNLMYAERNVIGNATWSVSPASLGLPWSNFDFNINAGMIDANEPPFIYKVISGPDTMYVAPISMAFPVANPCDYGTISGKIYIDQNTDCNFNSGDQNLQGVSASGNGYFTATSSGYSYGQNGNTNSSGNYSIRVQETWLDSFRVQLPSIYAFIYPLSTCNSLSYTYTSLPQTNANFAVQCADLDLSVHGMTGGWIRPMVPFRLYPHVRNLGCDAISGTLKVLLDPNVTYNAANSPTPPTSISGDTLIWNYTNLSNISNGAYWNSFISSIQVTPNVNVNIGDVLNFKIWTHVPGNDVNAANNAYTLSRTVVNSFDPNIKEVLPKGIGADNYISATTPKLRYTIHFQNTGNAPAINVKVLDTLKANIIPNTMKIVATSHSMVPNWKSNNVIEFKFNNINLADSVSNEPASHGFVTFDVDMVQGLAPETRIENRAFIYFDYNAPIETPTAFNTIENTLDVGSILKSSDLNVTVYPNPANDIVNFSMKEQANKVQLNIRDISGKLIFTQDYSDTKLITIESNWMSNGVYFYELKDQGTNQISNGKLIVN